MITDYEVITARKIADLQDRVREKIKGGWQPLAALRCCTRRKSASRSRGEMPE